MQGETERLSRAGNYVLGLMGKADRERAERDLEIDPAFREAVLKVAERMEMIDLSPGSKNDAAERWRLIAERIGAMPQMRSLADMSAGRGTPQLRPDKVKPIGQGLQAVPSLRAAIYAVGLIVAFAAGYFAALWSI